MRIVVAAALLILATCSSPKNQRQPDDPAAPAFDGAQASVPASRVKHGERLTWVLGCRSCHNKDLQGDRFYERYASNLTRELPKYSDAQLERVLRTGVPRDRRDLWGMPSDIFQHLDRADMAALIAELRTLRRGGAPTKPPLPWTKQGLDVIRTGELKPASVFAQERKAVTPVDLGPEYAFGRYITMVTCAECHGPQLKGHSGFTPDLVVASGYTRSDFERLMTEGVPTGGRKLGLMGEVARERFVHFTPHERDAIYAYLKARAVQH